MTVLPDRPAGRPAPGPTGPLHRRLALAGALIAALTLALLVGAVPAASPASAAPSTGWIRLAHLSPDTPKVDVYLTSFADSTKSETLRGVGYGALSPYQRIAPGTYSVSMRSAGAAADSPALLSTTVYVEGGKAYTVAGVGKQADISLRVLTDDLTPPPAGQARVRIVHASAAVPVADVTAGTAPLAGGVRFASTSDYATVPAGRTELRLAPGEGAGDPVTVPVELKAGSVYSVLVLDGPDGGLQVLPRVDAASAGDTPAGAVATGAGGTATVGTTPAGTSERLPLAIGVGLLTALLTSLLTGAHGRRREHAAAR